MLLRRVVLVLGLLVAGQAIWPVLADAVAVAPHAVFIDHRQRTAEVILQAGDQAEEVTIDLVYGYPASDSAGNVFIQLFETPDSTEPSAAGWIRAFPRRVRLEPNQRQIVRLLGNPPAGLPDREYWTRLIVTARGATLPVAGGDSAVRVGLDLVTRTIISVSYRKGEVQTGVRLTDFRARVEGDSLVAWVGLEREGNAAYLGTAVLSLRDAGGRAVRELDTQIAVYYGLLRRLALPLDGIASGAYTAHFRLTTDRTDLAERHVLPGNGVEQSAGVTVP